MPRLLWMRITAAVMAVVMYFTPAVLLADQAAHAAPIVDPRAPIPFRPTVTQTSTGAPAVNIAAPNSNGISVNQFNSLNIDSTGLVYNNSLVSGTPLLGGALAANPNLNGRAATTILSQVTSTAPSTLAGPLEIFGSPASLIISNPNGVTVQGLSVTNARNLVLTTGVPQFITGPGGSPTSFANAGAVSFAVSSGSINVNGPPGADGPGAGIEGTVGNIDLIGQSVNLYAPLYANQTVNVVAGNQTVTPATTSAAGTTYSTSNVVAGQPGVVAIDGVTLAALGDVKSIIDHTGGMNGGSPVAYSYTGGRFLFFQHKSSGFNVDYGTVTEPDQLAYIASGDGPVLISGRNVTNSGGMIVASEGDIAINARDVFTNAAVFAGRASYSQSCFVFCHGSASSSVVPYGGTIQAGGNVGITAGTSAANVGGNVMASGNLTVDAPLTYATGVTGYSSINQERGFKTFFGSTWAQLIATDVGGGFTADGLVTLTGDALIHGGYFSGVRGVSGHVTTLRAPSSTPVQIGQHLGLTTWWWY